MRGGKKIKEKVRSYMTEEDRKNLKKQ